MIAEKELAMRLDETQAYISSQRTITPELGIILGSGLGKIADLVQEKNVIPYEQIPHFPVSTVEGHSGKLIIGSYAGKRVMVLQGRFHFYEGYEMHDVTFPVRVMKAMGIRGLIVTNAAGGVNFDYAPGDLVLIMDHINLMGMNPLRGPNLSVQGPRFPDLSEAYSLMWREQAKQVMAEQGLPLREGVYGAVSGPSYETPAEIRYLRTIGADLVGMSTVPEVIVANHAGMKVLGISCVTNMAAGVLKQKLNHQEVIAVTERIEQKFIRFIEKTVEVLTV